MSQPGFFESENHYVRRLNSQTADAAQRSADRIRRDVQSADGRIEQLSQRLTALARRFDALVELSDIRAEQAKGLPTVAARDTVRPYLMGLTPLGDAEPLPAVVPSVPGYWLSDAVVGLDALLHDDPRAAELLNGAATLDAVRTARLVVLAASLASVPVRAEPWLGDALRFVTAADVVDGTARYVWWALAEGRYGDVGRAALADRLAELAASIPLDALRSEVRLRAGRLPTPTGPGRPVAPPRAPTSTTIAATVGSASSGAASLILLEQWFAPEGPGDRVPAPVRATDEVPLGDGAEQLLALVDEGTADEAPKLRRMALLESVVRSGEAADADVEAAGAPDTAASTGADLLMMDLLDGRAAAAPLREAAATALFRPVSDLADVLLTEACPEPVTELSFVLDRKTVTVTVDGAVPADVARVLALIDQQAAEEGATGNRRYAAEQLRRAETKKADATVTFRQAGERLAEYRFRLAEIRDAAEAAHAALMAHLGRLAEQDAVRRADGAKERRSEGT